MPFVIGCTILIVCLIVSAIILHRTEKKRQEYGQLSLECRRLSQSAEEAKQNAATARIEEESALSRLAQINNSISTNLKQLQATKASLETHEESIREQLKAETDQIMKQYRLDQETALLTAAQDFTTQFLSENSEKMRAAQELAGTLERLKENEAAAVRARQEREQEDFTESHKLLLDDISLSDIRHLRSIEGLLHNAEPLNKVIWKTYYEKPYTDLIGRLGLSTTTASTGIYKITHIESQKAYVGQAANIADRWRQHIKRGVGAETPINNKLYPAMRKYGPEAFTFEVLEICDRALLDKQEDYWQEFYKAKEFGYSIK